MINDSKIKKYDRLFKQIKSLFESTKNINSRLATIEAVLHHKMPYFFWTGVYLLNNEGELLVHSYQGPLACQKLKPNTGVCWAAVNKGETLIVDDVNIYPGHIACSSATNSEIVIPLRNAKGEIIGCFDVDSKDHAAFDTVDAEGLERILSLLYV